MPGLATNSEAPEGKARSPWARDLGKTWARCVGRESNPGQLLGRQLCSPLYHQRRTAGRAPARRRRLTPDSAQRGLRRRPPLTALRTHAGRPPETQPHPRLRRSALSLGTHASLAHSRAHSRLPGRSRLLAAATWRASPGQRPRGRSGQAATPTGLAHRWLRPSEAHAARSHTHGAEHGRAGQSRVGTFGTPGKRVRRRHGAGLAARKKGLRAPGHVCWR